MATPTPVFPAAIATEANLKVANNLTQTTLRVGVDAVNTILFVQSTAGFGPHMLVSIGSEIIAIEDVTGAPNPALLVASGGRGFDGTTAAAHSAGAKVQVLIDAWHHNALSTEIQAIEEFLGPNGQNLTSLSGSGAFRSLSYSFAPQSPGGSLAVGNNVVTLSPVPQGVNGTDTDHWLWISGGTGTAEAVLITGGTAVAGSASGTVIVNCANTHSGAWMIQSATGGIQEALIALGRAGTVEVNQTLAAPCLMHAPVTFPPAVPGQYTLVGLGRDVYNVERAADFRDGNLFQAKSAVASVLFHHLGILGSRSDGAVTGACIYAENPTNITFKSGALWLDWVGISGGEYGVRSVGVTVEIANTAILAFDQSFKAKAGIAIEGPFAAGVRRPASNHVISDTSIHSGDVVNANALTAGILLNGVDGLIGNNILTQGNYGLHVRTSGNNYNTLISFDILFIDQAGTDAVHFDSDGTGVSQVITLSNSHCSGAVNGSGVNLGFPGGANIGRVRLNNVECAVNGLAGIAIALSAGQVEILGGHILANNQKDQAFTPGIYLQTGAHDVSIIGVQIITGVQSGYAGGHHKFGIAIDGPSTNVIIGGNDLLRSSEGPVIQLNGAMAGGVISANTGISDASGITLAFAATIAIPVAPNFTVTGAGTVTAVTCSLPAGTTGMIQGSCTFTAGATIGNTITLTAGIYRPWFWDGTKFWIS